MRPLRACMVAAALRLRRAVSERLRDDRGDTLVESLAALLIAALGAAALATMVMASTNVVTQTSQTQARAFDAESQVYARSGPSESFGPAVTITAGVASESIGVTVYLSDDGSYARYVEGKE